MKDMQRLLQMGQEMQTRMQELQEELADETVTGRAGGDMVEATVDGKGNVRGIRLDPAVVDPEDVEMLEDLVVAAISDAQRRAREQLEERMKEATGGFPFGGGGGLPGLSGLLGG